LDTSRVPQHSGCPLFSKTCIITQSPSLFSNVYSKGNYWVCTGHCVAIPQLVEQATDLCKYLLLSHESERWCFENIHQEDNGSTIAAAISNRAAIAVSNGSFRSTSGTAAWVIKRDDCVGRIVGHVISPSSGTDQSPYRNELTGIYRVMKFCGKLCELCKITEGSIELACDGLVALNKAFSYVEFLSVNDLSYDLLATIKHLWAHSQLLWKIRQVRGHQDKRKSQEVLDQWGTLNTEIDPIGKAHILEAQRNPRQFHISEEPWSIYIGDYNIMKKLLTAIYEVVHSVNAQEYWMMKHQLPSNILDSIN
jgi:hypothetical protein